MSANIEKAKGGSPKAMLLVYEENRERVMHISRILLDDEGMALTVTLKAFKTVFEELISGKYDTEEEVSKALVDKAVNYCKLYILKQNPKAFYIPKNSNFASFNLALPDNAANDAFEAVFKALPELHRFIYALSTVCGFTDDKIAKLCNTDKGTVNIALNSQSEVISKISKEMKLDITAEQFNSSLKNGLQNNAAIPEKLDNHIYQEVQSICAPYTNAVKAKRKKYIAIGLSAAFAVLVLVWILFLAPKGNVTTTEGTGSGSSTTADGTYMPKQLEKDLTYYADIDIKDYGTITVKLNQEVAPISAANFVELAKSGFYDGLTFHRIMEGFMMQGGDPLGTSMGGSDNNIKGEFAANGHKNNLSHTRGAISMARSSSYNSASSQFFIVHKDSTQLDGDYAVFGYVTEGIEVVDKVCEEANPTDGNGTISAKDQPIINSIKIRTE